jgi:hypothetical protein
MSQLASAPHLHAQSVDTELRLSRNPLSRAANKSQNGPCGDERIEDVISGSSG